MNSRSDDTGAAGAKTAAPGTLQILEPQKCIDLSASTPIGRIGFVTDEGPLVLPVNFAWFENSIVFRTVAGQKLAGASDGQKVCFEVDHWNPENWSGWSVVIRGEAQEVTDWAEIAQLEQIGLIPWARAEWRPVWVRIEATVVTGRLLR